MAIRTIPRVKCRAGCEGNGYQRNAIPQLHKRLEATFGTPRNGYRKLPAETRQRVERNQTALTSTGIENDTQQTERARMGNVGYALVGIENDTHD